MTGPTGTGWDVPTRARACVYAIADNEQAALARAVPGYSHLFPHAGVTISPSRKPNTFKRALAAFSIPRAPAVAFTWWMPHIHDVHRYIALHADLLKRFQGRVGIYPLGSLRATSTKFSQEKTVENFRKLIDETVGLIEETGLLDDLEATVERYIDYLKSPWLTRRFALSGRSTLFFERTERSEIR